jgi:glycosyltransferase involved in cell wall biosynthesis
MAFGAIPVASPVSSIPQTFADTGAGVVVDGAIPAWVDAVAALVEDPAQLSALRRAGLDAAPRFGFTSWKDDVRRLFDDCWGLRLS